MMVLRVFRRMSVNRPAYSHDTAQTKCTGGVQHRNTVVKEQGCGLIKAQVGMELMPELLMFFGQAKVM